VGEGAQHCVTTGNNNTSIGVEALMHASAPGTGDGNTAAGFKALHEVTAGGFNTAVGQGAAFSDTTGSDNTAAGVESLSSNSAGSRNVATGRLALGANTTGDDNTAVGFAAGGDPLSRLASMSNCTFVGRGASANSDGLANSTAIGSEATISASNQVVLGNNAVEQNVVNGTWVYNGVSVVTTSSVFVRARMGMIVNAPAATIERLPPSPTVNEFHFLMNKGAGTVTVAGNGHGINGSPTQLVAMNHALQVIFDGNQWDIIASY
jgi:hypothetical protein